MRRRDTHIRRIKARLERMDAQLRQLEAKRFEAAVDVKIVYGLQLAMLRDRRDQLQSALDRFDGFSDETPAGVMQEPITCEGFARMPS